MVIENFESPSWLRVAYQYEGLKEIKGPKHNPKILEWLNRLGAWWADDESPWCGIFLAAVMQESHYDYPKMYMRAKAWLTWGQPIKYPVLGCVVILVRKGGGHVGLLTGYTRYGDLLILGGNQQDSVRVSQFSPDRVLGYRVPSGWDLTTAKNAPVISLVQERSTNEA